MMMLAVLHQRSQGFHRFGSRHAYALVLVVLCHMVTLRDSSREDGSHSGSCRLSILVSWI